MKAQPAAREINSYTVALSEIICGPLSLFSVQVPAKLCASPRHLRKENVAKMYNVEIVFLICSGSSSTLPAEMFRKNLDQVSTLKDFEGSVLISGKLLHN